MNQLQMDKKLEYIYKYITLDILTPVGSSDFDKFLDTHNSYGEGLKVDGKFYQLYEKIFQKYNPFENPNETINDLLLSNDLDNLIMVKEMLDGKI